MFYDFETKTTSSKKNEAEGTSSPISTLPNYIRKYYVPTYRISDEAIGAYGKITGLFKENWADDLGYRFKNNFKYSDAYSNYRSLWWNFATELSFCMYEDLLDTFADSDFVNMEA